MLDLLQAHACFNETDNGILTTLHHTDGEFAISVEERDLNSPEDVPEAPQIVFDLPAFNNAAQCRSYLKALGDSLLDLAKQIQ